MRENRRMEWQPETVETVEKIVERHLKECDSEQVSAFKSYRVEPFPATLLRNGRDESVVVVARRRDEVMYWEDVEEGFNRSQLAPNDRIIEDWCNQDTLGIA